MGGAELVRRTVRSAKCDRDIELAAGHREHVRSVVYDLVEGDKRETERHEFDDRPQPDHRGANAHAGKTVFTDGRVDDPFGPETLQQALAHFVSPVVFSDLFTHQKDVRIARQLFGERFVERLAIGNLSHALAPFTYV